MVLGDDWMNKKLFFTNSTIEDILNTDSLFIYGAGIMGRALKKCLEEEPYNKKISSFVVGEMANNPNYIDDVPVVDIELASIYKDEMILVALHEKHIQVALENLTQAGFNKLVPISFDSDIWSDIRGNWFLEQSEGQKLLCTEAYSTDDYPVEDITVYIVKSAFDRELKEKVEDRYYEIPIQVGAALTDVDISDIKDNVGDNISMKNRQFCELTAIYWMWKHNTSKYVGLNHYRRKFVVNEKSVKEMLDEEVDIILTVPVLNFLGVREQYLKDHDKCDWDAMVEAINILCPEYKDTLDLVGSGIYYFAYNMFITKKDIFDEYCEWLFPILFYCEEKIGYKEDRYQNRYVGFLAERLLTVYFLHNKDKYKIGLARKHFIETV